MESTGFALLLAAAAYAGPRTSTSYNVATVTDTSASEPQKFDKVEIVKP